MGKKNDRYQTIIEQLTHEIAWFKRNKFAKRSEQLSPAQGCLLDDLLDTDIAAIEAEPKALNPPAAPAWLSPARHWRSGSAKLACSSNPWSTHCAKQCLLKA